MVAGRIVLQVLPIFLLFHASLSAAQAPPEETVRQLRARGFEGVPPSLNAVIGHELGAGASLTGDEEQRLQALRSEVFGRTIEDAQKTQHRAAEAAVAISLAMANTFRQVVQLSDADKKRLERGAEPIASAAASYLDGMAAGFAQQKAVHTIRNELSGRLEDALVVLLRDSKGG